MKVLIISHRISHPEEQLALQNDVLIGKVLSKQHTNNSWIKLIASKNIICPSIDGENVYSGYYGIYNIYTLLNNLTKLTIAYTHPLLVLPQPRTQTNGTAEVATYTWVQLHPMEAFQACQACPASGRQEWLCSHIYIWDIIRICQCRCRDIHLSSSIIILL
jgi:hypothetical protein